MVLSQESGHCGGSGCSLLAIRKSSSNCSFASLSFRAFSCSAFRACSSPVACTAWRSSRWRFLLERSPDRGLLFPRRLHCLALCLALFAVAFPLRTIPFILSSPSFRFFWCGAHCFCYSAAAVATSRKKKLQ